MAPALGTDAEQTAKVTDGDDPRAAVSLQGTEGRGRLGAMSAIYRSVRDSVLAPVYDLYALRLWEMVLRGPVPHHLALILDGNRRFATRSGLRSWRDGYAVGAQRVDDVVRWSHRAGIQVVTLWGLSIDNLDRPADQHDQLTEVIEHKISELLALARARGWRLRGLGRRERMPESLRLTLDLAEAETGANSGFTVQFAIAYGGREEILDALIRWSSDPQLKGLSAAEALARLTPADLTPYLYAGDTPDPDLILRTSGELRLSGFLLWQSVYSEFYFTDVLWPEFREIDFLRALRDYQGRQQRYGR